MKRTTHLFVALALLGALSNTVAEPAKAIVSAAEIGTAVKAVPASVVFGGGIALPVVSFYPMLFEQGWVSHGSSGGMEQDAGGWRTFSMQTSKRAGLPRINGRVRFSMPGDGSVRGEWLVVPEADAPLLELCVAGNFDISVFAGATALLDGREIAIPDECRGMHFFRGPVSELVLRDRTGADRLRVAFDNPTRILLQDNRAWGGNNFTIRLFFAEGPVAGGREYAVRAAFSTPADGFLALNDGKPVTITAGPGWIPLANEPIIEPGSALDFTKVLPHHAPAGKFGRVVAVGDHFELEGLPGVVQRFYGVNICGDANTPSTPEAAERFAANLARIGYNSLRIHHHERAILGGKGPNEGAGPDFDDTVPDPAAMDRFDALVAACVKNGIYITTDLFVSRSHYTLWRSLGIDRDGCLPGTEYFKMLCAFWEPAYTNLCKWSRNFLGHVNPYTGRSLAEEPALCALALVNEGNLGNWGGARLREIPGVREAWEKWLDERQEVEYGFDWSSIPRTIPDNLYADDGSTPENRHSAAFAIFLADAEARLAERLTAFLRDELHCLAPVSSLSCWYNPVQYQMPRTGFDYVDDHFYVDHPAFLDKSWQLPSRCPNVNPIKGSRSGARPVVFRRLADKPFTITEWNYAGPGRYRGVGGIATGVMGALQNWSGMWRFAWSHGKSGVEKPETRTMGYFDMSGDPLGLAAERAALCLFLRGDLEPLKAEYPLALSERDLRNPANGAPKCQADSWLWAAWNARLSINVDKDGAASPEGTAYEPLFRDSATVRAELAALGATEPGDGAVSIDADTGTFLINTPRTAGGFAESGAHTAGPLHWELCAGTAPAVQNTGKSAVSPAQSGNSPVPATVWASSLDGAPIPESSHILLTHLTDVQNSDIKYADSDLTILLNWGKLPHLMRCGAAEVALTLAAGNAAAAPLRVYRLSPSGRRIAEVPCTVEPASGGVTLRFTARTDYDPAAATFLYEIERAPAEPAPSPAVAPAASARPVWGAAMSISAPADLFFRLGAYTSAWKFRGAFGGARVDGERVFAIDLANNAGDNVAAGALRFDGRASFADTGDGGVAANWTIVPDRDGELSEVMLEARFPLGRVKNGFLVDGRAIPIPDAMPEKAHLYRGPASRVEAIGPDGKAWLAIELPDSANILVQDNRSWGSAVATLRLFFVQGKVEAGRTYALNAVFRLPGSRLVLDEGEQVLAKAGPDWIPYVPAEPGEDWIEPGSALDLSSTLPHHAPAGKFGRVVAVGDHFEFEGCPGEEVRFCGVNFVHGANTPSAEASDRLAANLARMGFNSVRIHHHERPLLAKGDPSALTIDPGAQDRFDALVAACIRHGLYITTDLYVSRAPISWRSIGIDRDGTMAKEDFKTAAIFHEGAYSNLVAWSRQFMLHVNPYTGRSLAEEPALATLALINEGNLGNYGRDALLSIPGVREAWEKWCLEHGREPFDLSALPADLYDAKGDEKSLSNAFALFLADMELAFYHRLGTFVREELGCRAPLSNLSSWYFPMSYSLARKDFDYVDDHGYVDHPFFLGKQWSLPASHPGANPLQGGNAVPGFAWRRLFGKPFCVTEWNWAAPGKYRQASGLVMGALAARQGWSGMWRFAWSHDRPNAENPGSVRMRYFDLAADPTQCASERATLCLFLRGDLPSLPEEADGAIEIDEAALCAGHDAAKRLSAPGNAASGWERRIGFRLGAAATATAQQPAPTDGAANFAAPDPVRGAFTVATPCTAGGFALDGAIEAGPLSVAVADAPAAVWASSIDGRPIATSSRILVSHVTDSRNTDALFDDASCLVWLDFGKTPALMRRGTAEVALRLAAQPQEEAAQPPNLRVYRLSSTGHRIAEVPFSVEPASDGARSDAAHMTLRFTARTDYDPAAATLFYEIAIAP